MGLYLFCLIVGGGLLLVSIFGDAVGDLDADFDLDVEGDVDVEGGSGWTKLLSLRTVVYALFGFGAVGALLTFLQGGEAPVATAAFAALGGVGSGLLIHTLFGFLQRTGSGAREGDEGFIGLPARVVLPIRPDEPGAVSVLRGNRRVRLRALPHGGATSSADAESWTSVLVVEMEGGLARVVPVDEDLTREG